jgi:ATP-dependent DNA helicase RecQ
MNINPEIVLERLNKTFKIKEFREGQSEVISHVLAGGSGLVIMPTGFGKSLTYQLPATLLKGTTIVLSPLKALMKDQVDKLRGLGVRATFVNSSLDSNERELRQKEIAAGKYEIIYVTPERFLKKEFKECLSEIEIPLLVVDEAHCISQWGQDFRPEYGKVNNIVEFLKKPQVLALTATATDAVKSDIIKILGLDLSLKSVKLFTHSIRRPNLSIRVHDLYGWPSKAEKYIERAYEMSQAGIFSLQQSHKSISDENSKNSIVSESKTNTSAKSIMGTHIIYFSLIQSIYEFSKVLVAKKIPHVMYHGDLNENEKRRILKEFLAAENYLLLATPAFGLGIDKPDVRAVFHAEMPGSIEAYFQEIGRAGRDGKPAHCEFLFDEEDVATQMEFIKWSNPDAAFIRRVAELIERNPLRYKQERAEFIRSEMNFYNRRDFRAETSIQLLESWGVLDGNQILNEATAEQMAAEARDKRFKMQNEKLLQLLRLLKSEECRMQIIHKYFDEPLSEQCGVCDNCIK